MFTFNDVYLGICYPLFAAVFNMKNEGGLQPAFVDAREFWKNKDEKTCWENNGNFSFLTSLELIFVLFSVIAPISSAKQSSISSNHKLLRQQSGNVN